MAINTDVIMHHGIPGQKWGQQNGPPYPLKPEQHSAAEKKAVGKSRKAMPNGGAYKLVSSGARKISEAIRRRNPKRMSDEELRNRIARLKQEAEYDRLRGKKTKEQKLEIKIESGKRFASAFMTALGKRAGEVGTTLGEIAKKAAISEYKTALERQKDKTAYYEEKYKSREARRKYYEEGKEARKERIDKIKKAPEKAAMFVKDILDASYAKGESLVKQAMLAVQYMTYKEFDPVKE